MKLTSKDLYYLNIIDKVINEPINGAQEDITSVAKNIKYFVIDRLNYCKKLSPKDIVENRYNKFRNIGRCL